MLKHQFIIAIRNIMRNMNYSIINIGGLAIGLASFIFIILYINDELKYDKFHEEADHIYRVNRFYNSNDVHEDAATLSFPAGPTLQFDYPDMVEKVVRIFNNFSDQTFFEYRMEENNILKFNESGFCFADSSLFEIFTFYFLEGNAATALDRPNTMVITKSIAKKYFGDKSALGKVLRMEEADVLNFEITGVVEDIPSQSHIDFNMFASMGTFRQLGDGQLPQTWVWNPCWTYILLHEGISPDLLDDRMPDFYLDHYPDLSNQDVTLYLQPLTDIHLRSHHDYEMHPNSNYIYIYILSAIAAIVLILACINFMNLTTANSACRAREIGIKKVFGSSKKKLTIQFLGETILLSFLALIIAAVLVELLLPGFNNFTGKSISHSFILAPESILFAILLATVVGVIAGLYPAVFLASFKPLRILKGNLSGGAKSGLARKILVVFQFAISIALIIGTLLVFNQLTFIRKADLGFKRDQIILIPTVGDVARNYRTFKEELLKNHDIKYVTGMEDILGVNHNTRAVTIEGLDEEQQYWYPMFMVRHDFVEAFDIEIVEGRSFSEEILSDTMNAIMINETMAKNLGWTNQEAIGKRIQSDGDERVIGVFKDFHILSLHNPINNFILDLFRREGPLIRYVAIRVNSTNYPKLLEDIEQKWNTIASTRPFEYSFLDDELNNLYKDEDKFGKFSVILTILALIIASLGLIGLTSFLAEQKTKEIGIRRVLGASVPSVIKLLSNEFILLVLFANLIAWPLAWFFINRWLQNFHQRIDINWALFILAAGITLALSLLITSYRAIRVSARNPADTLRYE